MTELAHNGSMPRAKKDEAAKHVAHQIVFSPEVWADLTDLVHTGQRSKFVDAAVDKALDGLRIRKLRMSDGSREPQETT